MLFFPIFGTNFNGRSRVQPFDCQRLELLFSRLIRANQTLDVSINRKTFGFGFLSNSRLQSRVNCYGHTFLSNPINESESVFCTGHPSMTGGRE
jgi:hypothetical protein